jgi:hypothetical protein
MAVDSSVRLDALAERLLEVESRAELLTPVP